MIIVILQVLSILFLGMDIVLHALLLVVLARVAAGRGVAGLAKGVKRWLHYEDREHARSEEERFPKLY